MKDGKYYGLTVADLHFGAGSSKLQYDEHLYKELEEGLLNKIQEEGDNIDFVEILGDTSHRQIGLNEKSGKLQSKFILTLNNLSMQYDFKLRIIKGTLRHDYNQLEVYRKLELMNSNFKIFNTAEIDVICPEKGITFLQLPEEYVENEEEYYGEFLNLEEGKYDMVMMHGTFDFAGYVAKLSTSEKQMKNAVTFKVKDFKDIVYGAVMCGHIHTAMEKGNVFYCGSYSRFSFGEEEPKGYYEILYDYEEGNVELIFNENLLAPTYITIDANKLPKDIVKRTTAIDKFRKDYDYIRIKSVSNIDNEDDLKLLKEFADKDDTLKVEIVKNVEVLKEDHTYDFVLDRKLDIPETIMRFVKAKNAIDITLESIKEVLNDDTLD